MLLVLHGSEVASYFAAVFDADWAGPGWTVPVGLGAAVIAALAGAAALASRQISIGHASE
ncbi:MAG: hypothetical protein U5K37_01745 [Natrialbaceae archaeon]|nr:hypothetical protein [Natrialbaceae archaeon]